MAVQQLGISLLLIQAEWFCVVWSASDSGGDGRIELDVFLYNSLPDGATLVDICELNLLLLDEIYAQIQGITHALLLEFLIMCGI